MSISGNYAMTILRLIHPGKGTFSNLEKLKERAKKENKSFIFSFPKNKKAYYSLLYGTERECLIIRPKNMKSRDKAVLYIYGGVTNNWKTQRSMAVNYALDTGVEVWYPVYPSMSEVPVEKSIHYLLEIYQRMCKQFDPSKITVSGVSMGGFFALQMISAINQMKSDSMPGLILAHSPGGWPDREEDWNLYRTYEDKDPFFSEGDLRMTLKMTQDSDEYLYPMKSDFHNAPPTYLYYGEEMLAGSGELYQRAYEKAGESDKFHMHIEKNMMHGYSCMPVFSESKKAYYETIALIESL